MDKLKYIHIVGIEGTGHHFWEAYIPKLLETESNKNKNTIYYNNDHEKNLRTELRDIYWNTKCINERKHKYKKLRTLIDTSYKNCIIHQNDSYPCGIDNRKPEQNIDFYEFYKLTKDIIDFKFIFIERDFEKTCCARKYLDGGLNKHTQNMFDHILWLNNRKVHIDKSDYITIKYKNIKNDIDNFINFVEFDKNTCLNIFKNTFRQSRRTVSNKEKNIIKNIFNEKIKNYDNCDIEYIKEILNYNPSQLA